MPYLLMFVFAGRRLTDARPVIDVYASHMVRWPGIAIAFAIAFAFVVATPKEASSTVVKAMTLEEKTQASPLVVHAIVERIESEWELIGGRARTLITVRVIDTLKGEAEVGSHLILRQGGGTIGDFHQTAPGLDRYEEGDECVLFLEPLGPYLVTIGFQIGRYSIANGWVTYAPKIAELHVEQNRIVEAAPMQPERLDDFKKRVRSYARGIPVLKITPSKGVMERPKPSIPEHLRGSSSGSNGGGR